MLEERKVTYTDSDINDFCNTAMRNYREEGTAYIIMIGGKRYSTPAGKSVWKKKNHASSALTNHMSSYARKIAQERIIAEYGIVSKKEGYFNYHYDKDGNKVNIYKYSLYKDAYKNMLKELKTRGILKIVELNFLNSMS